MNSVQYQGVPVVSKSLACRSCKKILAITKSDIGTRAEKKVYSSMPIGSSEKTFYCDVDCYDAMTYKKTHRHPSVLETPKGKKKTTVNNL